MLSTLYARRRKHPCGRPSRVVLIPRRCPDAGIKSCETYRRATVANTPGTPAVHPGERGAAVKTIAQGMPDDLAEPDVACVRKVQFLCTQGARVRPAPGIPCALFSRGRDSCKTRTYQRRGNAEAHPRGCLGPQTLRAKARRPGCGWAKRSVPTIVPRVGTARSAPLPTLRIQC
jgi:hypothetical protein